MSDEDKNSEPLAEEVLQNAETETADTVPTTEASPEQTDTEPETPPSPRQNILKKFWVTYKTRKKVAIPLSILLLLGLLFAIPLTRYAVLGLVIKKDVLIYTIDSKNKGIVYNTGVTLDGKQPFCGADKPPYPNCFAKVPIGKHKLKVTAGYYETVETTITVGLGKAARQNVEIPMTATGRTAYVQVSHKITGKALADVHIKAGSSETVTNNLGNGIIVVDPSLTSVEVEVSADGYNTIKATVPVGSGDAGNYDPKSDHLTLTPTGKIYFLSKKSGRIDVIKTDLDGTNRQTVLAGTGKEEDTNTVLLASRDWKYLALLSRREGDKAKLYLIDTANDKLTEIDSGNASFSPVGWHDHYFVYKVYRNNVQSWQPRGSALKTYNAENLQLSTIDETNAEGAGNYDYAAESLGDVYIVKDRLVYFKNWFGSYYSVYRLADKRMGIYGVKPNGTGKQLLKDFAAGNNGYISGILYKPDEIYFSVSAAETSYYEYENGTVTETKDVNGETFYGFYPTYLLSPGGQKAFWYEPRDGKNTLFTGIEDGSNPEEIASLSEYVPYGWYTDKYLLVSKGSSELFILPVEGPGNTGQVLKVTDYHKPNYDFRGYGYGYGGY